ncbi:TPA: hypothetical protein QDA82_001056 [Burkholderia vietnamiensis]|nr:hypothetical protein [Burkholderia vietnamiensis]
MFKNRIAIAAGSAAAALLSQILPARGIHVDVLPRRSATGNQRHARAVAGRPGKSSAPRLKRPRTPADFDAVVRAEQKRKRKAAKLERNAFVHRCTYYVTRDAAVAEEAHRVYEALSQERAA